MLCFCTSLRVYIGKCNIWQISSCLETHCNPLCVYNTDLLQLYLINLIFRIPLHSGKVSIRLGPDQTDRDTLCVASNLVSGAGGAPTSHMLFVRTLHEFQTHWAGLSVARWIVIISEGHLHLPR